MRENTSNQYKSHESTLSERGKTRLININHMNQCWVNGYDRKGYKWNRYLCVNGYDRKVYDFPYTLRKKYPYSWLFWSKCGKIWTRIIPNTDTFHALRFTSSISCNSSMMVKKNSDRKIFKQNFLFCYLFCKGYEESFSFIYINNFCCKDSSQPSITCFK